MTLPSLEILFPFSAPRIYASAKTTQNEFWTVSRKILISNTYTLGMKKSDGFVFFLIFKIQIQILFPKNTGFISYIMNSINSFIVKKKVIW